jgi:uncharacterized membrane protein (UPF0127 family)
VARTAEPLFRADGTVVCPACVVADRPVSRLRGLLGRDCLGPGEALLIRPASAIHTFFMRFAIDVVFVDRTGVVLKIVAALRPWRFASSRGARCVLELSAGEAEARGIRPGDELRLPRDGNGLA